MNFSVIKIKKLLVNSKIESALNFWIVKFIALRSKACSFKCDDKNTNKWEGISKSQSKKVNLRNITIVFLEENIKRNVIISCFVQFIRICIFKKYVNLPYSPLTRNDVILVKLKVYLGINTNK